MQYSLGLSASIEYVARHFAKRAPSPRYSSSLARSPSRPSVTVSPFASASGCAPSSTLIPGMTPLDSSSLGNGVPSCPDWRIVSSKRITPLMYSSTPSVVNSRSRYARRLSSVDSTPIESKRFLIVPVLSSAARIPFPSATSARAVFAKSAIAHLLALSIPQQRLCPRHFLRAGRNDAARGDPPRGVDLGPAVSGVPDLRTHDGDARARFGNRHRDAVLRDHFDDQLAFTRPQRDVDVAVELLELHLRDEARRDRAALLHLEPLRVIDAGERGATAAIRRGRRRRVGPHDHEQRRERCDGAAEGDLQPEHP